LSIVDKAKRLVAAPAAQHGEAAAGRALAGYRQQLDDLMILQGQALAMANADRAPLKRLQDAEFKVFSQFGEDGVLQYLIRETDIRPEERSFVEFGVQSYAESCTRFLLMNNHWRGLIIDGSHEYMTAIRHQDIYWRHDLTAVGAWIDRGNINGLIGDSGFTGDIGVLVVDIDGNDYWVWERIEVVRPAIVVVEWNSVFGPRHAISVPYDPAFDRTRAHYSNLFWGASVAAFEHLGSRKGYALLGSNSAGNNLFFVRNDRIGRLVSVSAQEGYAESRFRDSRDRDGKLNFLSGEKRKAEILDLEVVDVTSGQPTTLRALDRDHV
jgi:hypothetical protein